MSSKLPNYLRTYRKRSGLSQNEVAFLLGCRNGTNVSRYEQFARKPNLETALALRAVFGAPVEDLLGGIYQKVEEKISKRAQLLARKFDPGKSDRLTARKLEALRAMSSGSVAEPEKDYEHISK